MTVATSPLTVAEAARIMREAVRKDPPGGIVALAERREAFAASKEERLVNEIGTDEDGTPWPVALDAVDLLRACGRLEPW
jgi:hypothetical protein